MEQFNPYHKWLGVSRTETTPKPHQLLGVESNEDDPEVIRAAAIRQSTYVRHFQSGQHAQIAARVLEEIERAKLSLLGSRVRNIRHSSRNQTNTPPSQTHGGTQSFVTTSRLILAGFCVVLMIFFAWRIIHNHVDSIQSVHEIGSGQLADNDTNVIPAGTSMQTVNVESVTKDDVQPATEANIVEPPRLDGNQPKVSLVDSTDSQRSANNATSRVSTPIWLNDGLVAHYPFDGNVKDAKGVHDGQPTDIGFVADRCKKENGAASFNGDTSKIILPDPAAFEFQSHTISFWMKYKKGQQIITTEPWSKANGYAVRVSLAKGSTLNHLVASRKNLYQENSSIVDLDGWRHVVAVFDGSSQLLYVDGKLVSSRSTGEMQITYSATPVTIGNYIDAMPSSWRNPDLNFNGALDDLRFYSKAITAGQVLELYGHEQVSDNGDPQVEFLLPLSSPPVPVAKIENTASPKPDQVPPAAIAPFDTAQAKAHQKAWADHLGVPVETTNSIGMKLVVIPAGEYTMGSPASEAGRNENEAQRTVTIKSPFLLGVHEVTQSQYGKVMGSNPSFFKGPDNPVETVSWDDAVAFCRKLSDLPSEKSAGRVYRLPTEAEWEYACRAGTMTEFSFGDDAKGLGDYAWFHDNSGSTTHVVGGKLPNGWGLYDMHGNVWEWCLDVDGSGRVGRGGARDCDAAYCRSAGRSTIDPTGRFYFLGFRLALSSPSVQSPEAENTASPKLDQAPPAEFTPIDTAAAKPDQVPPAAIAPFDAAQAKAHQKAWSDHLGVPVESTNSIGMKLVLIPPGEFMMGSPASEAGRQPPNTLDETQHRVKLSSPFLLGVYEVTQSQYESVMGSNPSSFRGVNNPVENVNWNDAVAFCGKLSGLPAERTVGRVYRLPTEAEWEHACRAGTTTAYSFGDDAQELNKYAWFGSNSDSKTHAVGGKLANGWGLHDMHGNVWEWCSDIEDSYRVFRGGGWNDDAVLGCRSAIRISQVPTFRAANVSFRLALSFPHGQSSEAEVTSSFGLPIGKRKTIHNLIHIPSGGPGTDLRWISVDVKEAETLTTRGFWRTNGVLGSGAIGREPDTLPLWRSLSATDNQYNYFLDNPGRGQRTQDLLAWVWTKRLPGMIQVFVLDNGGGSIMQLVSETDKREGGRRSDWLVKEQNWRQRFTFYVYPPTSD